MFKFLTLFLTIPSLAFAGVDYRIEPPNPMQGDDVSIVIIASPPEAISPEDLLDLRINDRQINIQIDFDVQPLLIDTFISIPLGPLMPGTYDVLVEFPFRPTTGDSLDFSFTVAEIRAVPAFTTFGLISLFALVLLIAHRSLRNDKRKSHGKMPAGVAVSGGHTGSVTLIQRFGSALNLNVHLHMLFLDGVYVERHGKPHFRRVSAPFKAELEVLVRQISERVGRHLERKGLLERDLESSWLTLDPTDEDDGMNALQGHSITYRIAVGPRAGQKAFTLQTLPALPEHSDGGEPPYVANSDGFSLHAGVAAEAWERDKLERLCRYVTRPPVADKRLSLAPDGNIRYKLKTPYRNGTTHVILEPMDLMARLAALVPRPRINLVRYHGVFAPASPLRGRITPARRGKGGRPKLEPDVDGGPVHQRRSMTWAQRLRRVFNIDIETCEACGGPVKVIASIEDPGVISKILEHLRQDEPECSGQSARGPPRLFD